MRGAEIIRIINLRALSFYEAPEKLRKFANFANLGISFLSSLYLFSVGLHQSLRRVLWLLTSQEKLGAISCIASPLVLLRGGL